MAKLVTIGGQQYKRRSPWGAWGLVFLTIGVYFYVWWYKINKEARQYLGDEKIKPAVSVLALIPGAWLIVPPFVSTYNTGDRISRMQEKSGQRPSVSKAIGILLYLLLFTVVPYYQKALNLAWDAAAASGGPLTSDIAPTIPPPPPV